MVHSSATECQTCDMNYYLKDSKTCTAFPTDCLGYSNTKCDTCSSSSIKRENMNDIFKNSLTSSTTDAQKDNWYYMLRQVKDNIRAHVNF